MDPERWKRMDEIFNAVLDREPSVRAEFLAKVCEGDDSLRIELERLIACHEKESNLFDRPPSDLAAALLAKEDAYVETISHYRILKKIGRGGMGEVYLAEDVRLNRKVALKILPLEFTKDKERIRRFEQEARAVSALNHPNILTIHDIGQTESSSFIATEYIDGESLRQSIRASKVPLKELLAIVIQVAEALDAAHQAGIIHRDIKPENIMVRKDGYVKVLDFGLAKLTEPATGAPDLETVTQTQTGVVIGTFRYMSPEQARGLRLDARTDIFSLGVVFYELIAGRAPFDGPTSNDVLVAVLERNPPPLRSYCEVPDELEWIVTKALAKEADERYQTAKELHSDLRRVKKRLEIAGELNHSDPIIQRIVRTRRWIVVVSIVLIALAGLTLPLTRRGSQEVATPSGKPIHLIAILPFANGSTDPNTEYLCDGITESIINDLSELTELRVMARSTVFHYKNKKIDPKKIGHDLNVDVVLTGSVERQDNYLTIKTELMRVKDGSQLWGQKYHRKLTEILLLQNEITREIVNRLKVKLTIEEQKRLAKHPTGDTRAYQFYLKGRYFANKRTAEGLRKAIENYNQAINEDPGYALAYAGLADTYSILGDYMVEAPKEAYAKAKAAVTIALQFDGELAEAQTSLGHIHMYFWDWSNAEKAFKRGIEIKPGYALGHQWFANYLMIMGDHNKALEELHKAQELDPLSLNISKSIGRHLYIARRFDGAIDQLQRTLELDPNYAPAHSVLSLVFAQKRRYTEAISESQRAIALSGGVTDYVSELGYFYGISGRRGEALRVLGELKEKSKLAYVSPVSFARIYVGLGQKDATLEWLQKGYEEHSEYVAFLKIDPIFDPLRSDPKFHNLLRAIGLPE